LLICGIQQDSTRVFPVYWILIGQFKFQAHRSYARWSKHNQQHTWSSPVTPSLDSNNSLWSNETQWWTVLMFDHGLIPAQNTARFNIRFLIDVPLTEAWLYNECPINPAIVPGLGGVGNYIDWCIMGKCIICHLF